MNALSLVSNVPIPKNDHEDNTLAGLVERLEARDSEALPDRTVSLNKVRMTVNGTLVVPSVQGRYAITDWARGQVAKTVGVNWGRWFSSAKPNEIAEEVNRRLARATEVVKLRSVTRVPQNVEANGTITAMVSPTYSPVPDALVGGLLRDALASINEDTKVVRSSVTDLTTSFVVTIGQPLTPSAEVGAVQGCIYVRNSQTGFARFVVQLLLQRKICSNGLVVSLPGSVLARQVHRGIEIDKVRERLVAGLRDLPSVVVRASSMMAQSTRFEVANVELEVRDLLREARLPLHLVPAIMASYFREPERSRFAVVQAVTHAAQSQDPEVRHDLETAAGHYLSAA